jgi:hypothetical protein
MVVVRRKRVPGTDRAQLCSRMSGSVLERLNMIGNGWVRLVFGANGSWGPKTRENGRK